MLSSGTDCFKRTVDKAAERCQWHMWKQTGARLFLCDLAHCHGLLTGQGNPTADDMPCTCPPCGTSFKNKSALGAHFKAMRNRCAAHRFYAKGTVCGACQKDYHSQRRLLMHLKVSPSCCDKLEHAGARHREAQAGIKNWNVQTGDDFVLCPPERLEGQRLPALPEEAKDRRAWSDNPDLETAFWKSLGWLTYCEGASKEELLEKLTREMQSFPLYTEELRLIFGRLADSVRHLIGHENMQLWHGFGVDALERQLREWARSFDASHFRKSEERSHILVRHAA